jgi:Heavy metal binding domain
MTHPAPPSATPDASHAEHSASAATPTTSAHASHGSHDSATQPDKAAERWTCPMHPEVIQSEPGKCPKCGMKLVPVAPKP